jgi:hypothetical protein
MRGKHLLVCSAAVALVFVGASAGHAQSVPSPTVPEPPAAPQGAPVSGQETPQVAAGAQTTTPAAPLAQPAVPAHGAKIEVPGGTHIPLVLHNGISTRSARPGDPVYFETLFPIMIDGQVAIPAGSYVSGEVTESKRPGRVKGRAEIALKLTTMILPNAYMVNLNASPSNAGTGGGETVNGEGTIVGDSDKASDAATVAKTTAAGAGIGGIARGGEGAGIGAGIGVAAGLAAVLLSRGPEAELPRGSTVEVVTNRSIFLDADKVQFTGPGQASALPGPPNREPQRNKVPF